MEFPVHVDHPEESLQDRFSEHSTLEGLREVHRLQAHDKSLELEPSGDTATSFNPLLRGAACLQSIPRTQALSVLILTETSRER
jgi:hypothetical protein